MIGQSLVAASRTVRPEFHIHRREPTPSHPSPSSQHSSPSHRRRTHPPPGLTHSAPALHPPHTRSASTPTSSRWATRPPRSSSPSTTSATAAPSAPAPSPARLPAATRPPPTPPRRKCGLGFRLKQFSPPQTPAASQRGDRVFTMVASFQRDEEGWEHSFPPPPSVPPPEARRHRAPAPHAAPPPRRGAQTACAAYLRLENARLPPQSLPAQEDVYRRYTEDPRLPEAFRKVGACAARSTSLLQVLQPLCARARAVRARGSRVVGVRGGSRPPRRRPPRRA